MKRKVKIFSIIMLIIITLSSFMGTVSYGQETIKPGDYNPNDRTEEVPEEFTKTIGIIATGIQTIGIILSVIVIGILGIKFMTGSVEEKADYKKSIIPYLVGTILLVTIGTIIRIINNLTTQAMGD